MSQLFFHTKAEQLSKLTRSHMHYDPTAAGAEEDAANFKAKAGVPVEIMKVD